MGVSIEIQDGVAVVSIDNPPVNAVSHAVRAALLEAVHDCAANTAVRAVVLACAGRTFVAGADIREFDRKMPPPDLPEVVAAIEGSAKPWIAAIHGHALGGGLELALGCHGRVAAKGAKLGLPEVNLGLIPGAGGTVRLPRLIPAAQALEMAAGGTPVHAEAALETGLVDRVCAPDALRDTARRAALAADASRPTLARPVQAPKGLDAARARWVARARGQHSVVEAADAVMRAATLPAEAALAAERATFLRLKGSAQSVALRHIFFAERATLRDPRCKLAPRGFENVAVVGGGTMGAGIAVACLLAGLDVVLVERDDDAARAAQSRVEDLLAATQARGLLTDAALAAARARFLAGADDAVLAACDLVIEAVFEDMDAKREVFARLDRVTRPEAVLATNTSYLDVNEIAAVLANPSRVVGLHFFSPAHVMKLLEIVLPDAVGDDVVATAAAFAKRLRKVPVLARVAEGFVGNSIMAAYRDAAEALVAEGAAPEAVDAAMRDYGFAMGIFEVQDLAGLDIAWARRRRLAGAGAPDGRGASIADRLCEAGRFGRKTGAGWYRYADGGPQPDPSVTAIIEQARAARGIAPRSFSDPEIMARVLGALHAQADRVLAQGIAAHADDIDVVMVNGYGFPRWRGGPMHARAAGG